MANSITLEITRTERPLLVVGNISYRLKSAPVIMGDESVLEFLQRLARENRRQKCP